MKLTSPLYRINTISVEVWLGYILGMSGVRQKLTRKNSGYVFRLPAIYAKGPCKVPIPGMGIACLSKYCLQPVSRSRIKHLASTIQKGKLMTYLVEQNSEQCTTQINFIPKILIGYV